MQTNHRDVVYYSRGFNRNSNAVAQDSLADCGKLGNFADGMRQFDFIVTADRDNQLPSTVGELHGDH